MPEVCGALAAAGECPAGSAIVAQAGAEHDDDMGIFDAVGRAGQVNVDDEGGGVEQCR